MKTGRISNAELRDIQAQARRRGARGRFCAPAVEGAGACVGGLLAAAIAAAGATVCDFAGRVACETDYLAISGATFPPDVPREELEAFNRRYPLSADATEADERLRYEAIAGFFHGRAKR